MVIATGSNYSVSSSLLVSFVLSSDVHRYWVKLFRFVFVLCFSFKFQAMVIAIGSNPFVYVRFVSKMVIATGGNNEK